jgi:hypothetical protein
MVSSDGFIKRENLESKAEESTKKEEPITESYYYGVIRCSYNSDLTNEKFSDIYPIVISEKPTEFIKRYNSCIKKDQMFSNKEITQIGPFVPIAKGSYDIYKSDAKELMERRDKIKDPMGHREYENNLLKVVSNGYTPLPLLDRDEIKLDKK